MARINITKPVLYVPIPLTCESSFPKSGKMLSSQNP